MKLWIWQTFGFWQIPSIWRFFGEQLSLPVSRLLRKFHLGVFGAQSIFRIQIGGRMWLTYGTHHILRRILEDSTTWEEESFSTQKRHENLSHLSAFVWQRHPSPTTKKRDTFLERWGRKWWTVFCFTPISSGRWSFLHILCQLLLHIIVIIWIHYISYFFVN